jgi:hypothetical protein
MAEKTENHKGFVITWEDPPFLSGKWTASVGSNELGHIKNIEGQTREDMLIKARQYIDDVLRAHGHASV